MKKFFFFLVVLSSLFLTSSTKRSAAPVPVHEHYVYPIDDWAWSDCTGESIHITGQIMIDIHGIVNNNRMNFVIHDNYSVQGIGETSGKLYAGSGLYNESYNGNFTGSYTLSGKSKVRLNTSGGQNNLVLTMRAHTTVNAQGIVTVNRFSESYGCQ
jgi:hypothetical protein